MINIIKDSLAKKNLIVELVRKDLKIRYSRPILGFFWAFLLPFLTAVIFYLIFSLILKIQIAEAPFLLYVMSAIFSWRLFQDSIMASATSLIDNKTLIRESNFPHYLIPVSIALANVINLLPAFLILTVVSLCILKGLSLFILLLPIVLLVHLAITLGLSIAVSIFYVKWRDIKYILEALLMLLFYFTPVFYSISLIRNIFPDLLYKIYIYNPFVCILNLYRLALLKGFYALTKKQLSFTLCFLITFIFAILVLCWGLYLYRKNKDIINDYLSY
jgi:lipopolysaccharide transport system permease protein